MKLRNKKTGKIVELTKDKNFNYDIHLSRFNSLAELNEEWEDYEDSKDYYFIRSESLTVGYSPISNTRSCRNRKQIGNYFETREDAEKAVEKLKAWQRLKEKGFVFKGVNEDDGSIKTGLSKSVKICESVEFYEDMSLLFGDNNA